MSAYEGRRMRPDAELALRTRETLERFLASLAAQDVGAIELLLAEDVRSVSDAGGEFAAAHNVVVGRSRVARLILGLTRKHDDALVTEVRVLNGLPAIAIEVVGATGRIAPRFVLRIELDRAGRIAEIHSILASQKLTGLSCTASGAVISSPGLLKRQS